MTCTKEEKPEKFGECECWRCIKNFFSEIADFLSILLKCALVAAFLALLLGFVLWFVLLLFFPAPEQAETAKSEPVLIQGVMFWIYGR